MKLLSAQLFAYAVPFQPLRSESPAGPVLRRGLFLELNARAGNSSVIRGQGEMAPWPPPSGSAIQSLIAQAETALLWLGGRACPETAADLLELSRRMRLENPRLQPAVLAGLETALADLAARRRGLPLRLWLNPAARREVPVNAVVPRSGAGLEEFVRRKLAEGIRIFKVKVGGSPPGEDRRRLEAIQRLAAGRARFRLDANRAWTFPEALQALNEFSDFPVEYVEEPLRAEERGRLPELFAAAGIPFALDESLLDPESGSLWKMEGVSVLVLKPSRAGGMAACREWIARARKTGRRFVLSSAMETGLGIAAWANWAAAWDGGGLPAGLDTLEFLADSLAEPRLKIARGAVQLPAAPGTGVQFARESRFVELVRRVEFA